jgi:hypothetical protein
MGSKCHNELTSVSCSRQLSLTRTWQWLWWETLSKNQFGGDHQHGLGKFLCYVLAVILFLIYIFFILSNSVIHKAFLPIPNTIPEVGFPCLFKMTVYQLLTVSQALSELCDLTQSWFILMDMRLTVGLLIEASWVMVTFRSSFSSSVLVSFHYCTKILESE